MMWDDAIEESLLRNRAPFPPSAGRCACAVSRGSLKKWFSLTKSRREQVRVLNSRRASRRTVEKGKEWEKRRGERWRNGSEAWRETGALVPGLI
jgi:hypothetical protein